MGEIPLQLGRVSALVSRIDAPNRLDQCVVHVLAKLKRISPTWVEPWLNLQPRLLQVELAFDPSHHLGADLASVPKPDV